MRWCLHNYHNVDVLFHHYYTAAPPSRSPLLCPHTHNPKPVALVQAQGTLCAANATQLARTFSPRRGHVVHFRLLHHKALQHPRPINSSQTPPRPRSVTLTPSYRPRGRHKARAQKT